MDKTATLITIHLYRDSCCQIKKIQDIRMRIYMTAYMRKAAT